jgi:TetR/AcrR family transcriptional regulator
MPKQTFFNLSEEKRELITSLAIEEFAEHDYDLASISRIVAQAKIAKGSFYQYFENKRDLYFYLLDLAAKEKVALLRSEQPQNSRLGLFESIRWLFTVNLRFQLARPKLNRVAHRSVYGNNLLRGEILALMKENATEYYHDLVQKGIKNGDIDPKIDPGLATFVLGAIYNEFGNYLVQELQVDLSQLIDKQLPEDIYQKMMVEVDRLLDIIQNGLAVRTSRLG